MAYCISVWGSVKKKLFDRIFTLQKRVLRCLFGDKKRYLDKFSTAARTRPIGEPLTDVTTANATTADSTANVTTADVLVLGYGLWVRVWGRVWVRVWVMVWIRAWIRI